jgi:hypothetical protein
MQSTRQLSRAILHRTTLAPPSSRYISSSFSLRAGAGNASRHPNADAHGEAQKNKENVPHMTNTTSTFDEKMPSVGADKPPPEFISSVDPNYKPTDANPENTERMTGGTQPGNPDKVSMPDLGVGEMEGASFKVEPLRRTGEDSITMRARLLCPSLPMLFIPGLCYNMCKPFQLIC